MKLGKIYEKIIELGRAQDPRGVAEVDAELADNKKAYEELKGFKKEIFDVEKLKNPYADSRILHGDPNLNVRKIMVGIDGEGPEVLLADKLREKGTGPDLLLAHHPEGHALARLADVMGMQSAILAKYGVPINVAEDLMASRITYIDRAISPGNSNRAVAFARALNVPMMCAHTPADNHVATYLQNRFDKEKPRKVKDVLEILNSIEEYKISARGGTPPTVFVGSEDRRAGKVFVDMTGGTEGNSKIHEKLAQAGVGTIVGMHISEDGRKQAEEHHINVVIAGHIASDTLGLNLLFDGLCKIEPLQFIECSGFTRIDRSKETKKALKKK